MKAVFLAAGAYFALCACSGSPVIVSTPSACSTLVPEAWHTLVPGAAIPDQDTVGAWIAFGDAQTSQLDRANGRAQDTLAIISACEKRDAAALKKSKPRFLGIF